MSDQNVQQNQNVKYNVQPGSYILQPNMQQPRPVYVQQMPQQVVQQPRQIVPQAQPQVPSDVRAMQMQQREIESHIPKAISGGNFHGLKIRPGRVRFSTQNRTEKVYVLVRKHWVTNVEWVISTILYILLLPVLGLILDYFQIRVGVDTALGNLVIVAYYSIIITGFLRSFLDWYFDLYIVTNERIVSLEFKPFQSYEISEAGLENIEEVKERSAGPIANLFGFGDVIARTASDRGEFVFKKVFWPTKVRDIISDLSFIAKKYRGNK